MKSDRDSPAKRGSIYRPTAIGWQKWSEDVAGWSLLTEASELSEMSPAAGDLIAIPARRVFSLPIWVPADDPDVFRDLVFTQLEMRGMAGRARQDTAFSWREIKSAGNEALLHVSILPFHLASSYWHGEVTEYAVSPSCLPLDANAVSLWREQGAWVAAITTEGKLLHFQSLVESAPDSSMASEVWLMMALLEAGNMAEEDLSVVIYHQDGDNIDLAAWTRSGKPAVLRDFPPPVWPAKPLECVPLVVRDLQAKKMRSARHQRLAFTAAAIYLFVVLALSSQTLWLHWKARKLKSDVDRDAPAVAETQKAMKNWQALQPALEPSGYPLEILYQTARLLPKDGVRLTVFEMNLDRVVIQGEASTLAAALKFQDDLKKNAELEAAFEWTAEAPKQLPNGSTRFQVDGARRGPAEQKSDESTDI